MSQAIEIAINIRGKYNQRKAIRDIDAFGITLRVGKKASRSEPVEKAAILYFFLNRITTIAATIKNIMEAVTAILIESAGYETP
jgi:hypothetical protein